MKELESTYPTYYSRFLREFVDEVSPRTAFMYNKGFREQNLAYLNGIDSYKQFLLIRNIGIGICGTVILTSLMYFSGTL